MGLPVDSTSEFAYLTRDLQASAQHWADSTRAGPFFLMHAPPEFHMRYRGVPGRETTLVAVGFLGTSLIELLQPTNDAPSIFRDVLEEKGEVFHHIAPNLRALSPAEFDALHASYLAAGLELVSDCNVAPVGRTAFFDARATMGIFIELAEFREGSFDILNRMYDAHIAWDGSRPLRDVAELFASTVD